MNDEAIDRVLVNLEAVVAQVRELKAPSPPKFITPIQAAAMASVPVKRIYDWARNKRWAVRPTRRTLRIEEDAFKRWLVRVK